MSWIAGERSGVIRERILYFALLFVQAVLTVILLRMLTGGIRAMSRSDAVFAALDLFCLILNLSFYVTTLRSFPKRARRNLYHTLLCFAGIYQFADGFHHIAEGQTRLVKDHFLINEVYAALPVIMLLLFLYWIDAWNEMADEETVHTAYTIRIKAAVQILAAIQIILILCNYPGRFLFTVSADGWYVRGSVYFVLNLIPFLMTGLLIVYICMRIHLRSEQMILMLYPLMPIACQVVTMLLGKPMFVSQSVFLSLMILYLQLNLRRERIAFDQERMLGQSYMRIMQMQINPHFLQNTLASVASLCESDPAAAREMTYRLSDYFRSGFRDEPARLMIPFREELENLRAYAEVEKMRFPGVSMQYEIEADQFMIPAMTLQPLVENAIRHGIRARDDETGTITITTRKNAKGWEITVHDDGVGFNQEQGVSESPGIGIKNVRTRLRMLCDGRLEISSTPGEGTLCTLYLSKSITSSANPKETKQIL